MCRLFGLFFKGALVQESVGTFRGAVTYIRQRISEAVGCVQENDMHFPLKFVVYKEESWPGRTIRRIGSPEFVSFGAGAKRFAVEIRGLAWLS